MQMNLLTFVSFLASLIIGLEITVIFNLRQLSKKGKDNRIMQDKHYIELNLKFQYLQTFLILAGILIVFLGWNVKDQIIEGIRVEIKSDVEKQVKKVEDVNMKIENINKEINKLENRKVEIEKDIESLTAENEQLKKQHKKLKNELEKRTVDIKTLLRIYIVTDIPYGSKDIDTLYYKDLPNPINAKELPEFKKTPVVNVQTTTDKQVFILECTTDYMIINLSAVSTSEGGILTLWIVDRY